MPSHYSSVKLKFFTGPLGLVNFGHLVYLVILSVVLEFHLLSYQRDLPQLFLLFRMSKAWLIPVFVVLG